MTEVTFKGFEGSVRHDMRWRGLGGSVIRVWEAVGRAVDVMRGSKPAREMMGWSWYWLKREEVSEAAV